MGGRSRFVNRRHPANRRMDGIWTKYNGPLYIIGGVFIFHLAGTAFLAVDFELSPGLCQVGSTHVNRCIFYTTIE